MLSASTLDNVHSSSYICPKVTKIGSVIDHRIERGLWGRRRTCACIAVISLSTLPRADLEVSFPDQKQCVRKQLSTHTTFETFSKDLFYQRFWAFKCGRWFRSSLVEAWQIEQFPKLVITLLLITSWGIKVFLCLCVFLFALAKSSRVDDSSVCWIQMKASTAQNISFS